MKKKLLFVSFLVIVGILAATLTFYTQHSPMAQKITTALPTATKQLLPNLETKNATKEVPFEELTIPYLREQTYQSQLSELIEVKNTATHRGYTTSYLSDGLRVNGYLAVPKDEAPAGGFPAVVLVHGYIPPQNYSTLGNYMSFADTMAAQGVVVFKTDLRGHGDSEGEASGAYFSSDYIVDTLNAYNALQNNSSVDSNKVGLWGHSMAGNVLFRSMAAEPSIPKVVIWAGAVYTYQDMIEYGIQDSSYQPPAANSQRQDRRNELFATHDRSDTNSDFWQMVTATNYTDEIQGELHIHHAINDNVVSIEYSRNLMTILDETAIPHQLYEYQTGGHNLTGSTFNQAIQRTADFLKN